MLVSTLEILLTAELVSIAFSEVAVASEVLVPQAVAAELLTEASFQLAVGEILHDGHIYEVPQIGCFDCICKFDVVFLRTARRVLPLKSGLVVVDSIQLFVGSVQLYLLGVHE